MSSVRKPTAPTEAAILFTAFEPSGDAHAAPVIRELRRESPSLPIYAWGGRNMQEAGATVLEQTIDDASMGLSALKRASYVRQQVSAIRRWAAHQRVLAHVAVDSPAANFPICKVMKRAGARIIHLVAPQLWAWGRWRVGKLRRLSDLVLCILPFEEGWFRERGVPARFIGHHVMNEPLDVDALRAEARRLPQGSPRIAILPGSRPQEVNANIRLLVNVYTELQSRHAGTCGVIVAANPRLASIVRSKIKIFPHGLHMTSGRAAAAIAWCDFALTVSGTVTLDLARQCKPMIGIYKTGLLSWLGSKLILKTPYRLLPNIVADREICPEFVPYVGGPSPILNAAMPLITDSKNLARQSEELRRMSLRFANKRPAEESARLILQLIRTGSVD